MSLQSTYQLRHSLPNRSPSQRPQSMSLADYQPLNFDRDALESAYQAALSQPTSSSTSARSGMKSDPSSARASTETHDTSASTLSGYMKPGSNPHVRPPPLNTADMHAPEGGFAGVGAGHSLTPPQSPFHKPALLHQQHSLLSPVPPSPPPRPSLNGKAPARPSYQGSGMSRNRFGSHDYHGGDQEEYDGAGYETDPGPVVSGRVRRDLPPVPTNVPQPELPQWEPDYKPQIPADLTNSSIANAYAQLSAPPPNLPPRRNRPVQNNYGSSSQAYEGPSGSSSTGQPIRHDIPPMNLAGPSSQAIPPPTPTSPSVPVAGAPDFPPTPESLAAAQRRPRPEAEREVFLRATERTPIWSSHILDPALRDSQSRLPQQLSNVANAALSGLGGNQKSKYSQSVSGGLDGLAKAAKDWVVAPDGRFYSENGGIEVGLGIVDSGLQGWERDKARSKAKIEIISRSGGIKLEVLEIDHNRQLDAKIESRFGDILILLPKTYHGALHVHSLHGPPTLLPLLGDQCEQLNKAHSTLYTTFVVPHGVQASGGPTGPPASRVDPSVSRMDQFAASFMSSSRDAHSKVVAGSQKGRVIIGYRETKDEADAVSMGLKVGAQGGARKKRWWRG